MSTESPLMRELQIAASAMGARLFRQNSGLAWIGRTRRITRATAVPVMAGDVVVSAARPFRAGIPGMSDLGGWVPVTITPDMVGSIVAVYAQVEVKDGGRASGEQLRWISAVRAAGGRAGVAHNISELQAILAATGGSTD